MSRSIRQLDWDFSGYSKEEILRLYNYEFSRGLESIRDLVEYLRFGKARKSSYWAPIPKFGWPEWPRLPYLSIPEQERIRRIKEMGSPLESPRVRLGLVKGREITIPDGADPDWIIEEVSALIRSWQTGKSFRKAMVGRRATKARTHSQLNQLSAHRLLEKLTAAEAIQVMGEAGCPLYTDTHSVHKAARQARKHLLAFLFQAETLIQNGRWFFPFSAEVIHP